MADPEGLSSESGRVERLREKEKAQGRVGRRAPGRAKPASPARRLDLRGKRSPTPGKGTADRASRVPPRPRSTPSQVTPAEEKDGHSPMSKGLVNGLKAGPSKYNMESGRLVWVWVWAGQGLQWEEGRQLPKEFSSPSTMSPVLSLQQPWVPRAALVPLSTWISPTSRITAAARLPTLTSSDECVHPTMWSVGTTLPMASRAGLCWMPCWRARPSGGRIFR